MSIPRIITRQFAQNLTKKASIPSHSNQVLKAFQSNFAKHPSSYTPIPLDTSRLSHPSTAPLIRMQIPNRAFSSSPEPFKVIPEISKGLEDSLLIEKTLEKIEQDPEKLEELLKTLSPELHEKLALTLVEKNPEVLYPNLLLFTIKDEKILVDVCKKLLNSEKLSRIEKHAFTMFLIDNFKHFKFKDRDFIIKIASYALSFKGKLNESFFLDLGITDPEIIQYTLIHKSKIDPKLFLSKYTDLTPHLASLKPDILEKILLNIAENLPIDHTTGGMRFGDSPMGSSSLNIFAKILPRLTTDPKLYEKLALYIAKKDPLSLKDALKPLNLSKETLKIIIPKIIVSVKDPNHLKKIIEELPTLGFEDFSFIKDSIITLSDQNPKALIGNLKSLHLTEDTLQKVIPKMIDSTKDYNDLVIIVKELPSFGIQDQSFMEAMAIAISHKNPEPLAGNLKPLNLTESVLKEVITKILDQVKTINNKENELHGLLKELPTLGIQDEEFIANIALFAAKHDPESIIKRLNHLNLKPSVLESIISRIISIPCNPQAGPRDTFDKILLLKKLPTLPLNETLKNEFCEKIVSILLKNHAYYCPLLMGHLKSFNLPQKTLEALINHIMRFPIDNDLARFAGHSSKVEFYKEMLKELTTLDLDEDFLEKRIEDIFGISPRSFAGLLSSLPLKENALKEIISKIVQRSLFSPILSGKDEPLAFLKDLQTLDIKDKAFLSETLIYFSEGHSSVLELKDFSFTDKKTFAKIVENFIPKFSKTDQFDLFLEEIMTYDIKEPEFIIPIAQRILNYYTQNIEEHPNVLEKLTKLDPETNLPFFVKTLSLESFSLRKELAENLLKFLAEDDRNITSYPKRFGLCITLLGLEEPDVLEDILSNVLRTRKVPNNMLSTLYQDPRIGDRITPSFFLDKWDFDIQKELSKAPSSELTSLTQNRIQSKEILSNFFQRPEIKEALSQTPNTSFKDYLFGALIALDKANLTSLQRKLDALIEICDIKAEPLPPLKEITGNLILIDMLASTYDYYVYTRRLSDIQSLTIQNSVFFEKAALRLAKNKPEFLMDSIEVFNISNSKTLEAIGVAILSKDLNLFERYKLKVNLSKQSLLAISTDYGTWLHKEGKCILPTPAVTEIFNQILKYRNESLSNIYLSTFLENITSTNYQKALGQFTLTGKTKGDPIFIHKILPGIFLAKWDEKSLDSNLPFRKTLVEFLSDPDIRKTLRDSGKPLIQNLLFAASDLDKDSSLSSSEKLKLFAQICNLHKGENSPSALEIADNLRTLRFFSSLHKSSALNHTFTKSAKEELSTVFKQVAIQNSLVPNLAQVDNIEEKYIKTFVTDALIPGSLATYEAGFRSMYSGDRQAIFSAGFLEDFSRFVLMCLEKTPDERYRTDINPNLLELSENFPDTFNAWKRSLPPIEVEFSQKILESKPMKDLSFISLIETELKEYKDSPLTNTIQANLKAFSKNTSTKEQLELLKLIDKELNLLDPVPMDALKSLEKAIFSLSTSSGKQKLTVKDIDDPLTLFEMPTLVCQSCQNITANANYNKCLIGYSIEGATRMIAIQDNLGNFLARSVLRVCFDEHYKPFLLLEPVYTSPKISAEEAKQDIYEGALQKAESTKLPLFTRVSDSLGSKKQILSKGGAATTYYSDSSLDKAGSHRIEGKIPQELDTVPLLEVTREQFQAPILWPKDPSKQ